LSPAGYNEAITLTKVVKYVWLEAYDEIAGIRFMRTYVPKQILVVASAAYNGDTQSTVLGTAEGGLKVILYNVNNISNYVDKVELLNKYYFHTMHHEFAHILHQAKNYDPDFKKITESDYIGSEWTEKTDTAANKLGFVTAYSMDQPDEDFVEIIACRVTNDQAWWDKMLEGAGKEGAEKITHKFEMVNNYLRNLWNIDIDRLRSVVLRRSKEVKDLDLNTL
jgi:substrate import-associated zinc metallohydrolase lipoprotein